MGLVFGRIFPKRTVIQLMGLTHSGKTTMLTALERKGNITDEDVNTYTNQPKKFNTTYKADNGLKYRIISKDIGGHGNNYEQESFEKELHKASYYIYVLDLDIYLKLLDKECSSEYLRKKGILKDNEDPRIVKETIESYFYVMWKDAQNMNKQLVIVGSHQDMVQMDPEQIKQQLYKSILRGRSNYLLEIGNLHDYKFVKSVLDKLLNKA